jgi:hypothetical protein
MTDCPCEDESQHQGSPGLVADNEIVCRGTYDPMHYRPSGTIKPNFVRKKDLANGELSIWRLERDPAFGVAALADQLTKAGPAGNTLRAILAATAMQIRELRVPEYFPEDQRVLCVADDCRTDDNGGWHPEHATVSLAQIAGHEWDEQGDQFGSVAEGLVAIFKAKAVWPQPN